MRKPYLYFASPLFSQAEREFNCHVRNVLLPYFDVFLPQEDGALIVDLLRAGLTPDTARKYVFKNDIDAINRADVLLIVLDGRSIDEGASFELGFAYAKDKLCVGLQTDARRLLSIGNNPMIDEAVARIFSSVEELLRWAQEYAESVEREFSISIRQADVC
jgi:nucleoside 2-deoxyribosyltransferase